MDAFTAIFTPFVASSAEVAAPASAARGETKQSSASNGYFCVIA
jgi:hypothetical protein